MVARMIDFQTQKQPILLFHVLHLLHELFCGWWEWVYTIQCTHTHTHTHGMIEPFSFHAPHITSNVQYHVTFRGSEHGAHESRLLVLYRCTHPRFKIPYIFLMCATLWDAPLHYVELKYSVHVTNNCISPPVFVKRACLPAAWHAFTIIRAILVTWELYTKCSHLLWRWLCLVCCALWVSFIKFSLILLSTK